MEGRSLAERQANLWYNGTMDCVAVIIVDGAVRHYYCKRYLVYTIPRLQTRLQWGRMAFTRGNSQLSVIVTSPPSRHYRLP